MIRCLINKSTRNESGFLELRSVPLERMRRKMSKVFSVFLLHFMSRSGCGNVEKSGRFFAGLFQALEGSDAVCRFPHARHFHSRFARLVVCALALARLGCANGSGQ